MALKGTLKDFSVADIFQLIGQQTKSGSLYVRTEEKEAHIIFDEGKIVLGTFRKSHEDFLLGTMLLRAQVITSDQLTEAIENQKITLRSLGDILRSMGAITPEHLSEFVTLQLKEVLFRLFQWKEGFYEFVAEQIRYNKTIIRPQSAEAVLMDGFRMLDEWPQVSKKVGALESVYRVLVDPVEVSSEAEDDPLDDALDDAFAALDSTSKKPTKKEKKTPPLSEENKRVLRLMDGNRSVQEIVYLSRLGTFDTCRTVADLLNRSKILKIDQLGQTRVETTFVPKAPTTFTEWLTRSYLSLIALLALSIALPALVYRVPSVWRQRYFGFFSAGGSLENTHHSILSPSRLAELDRIRQALELYRLEKNDYPLSLESLSTIKLYHSWRYRYADEDYILYPQELTE